MSLEEGKGGRERMGKRRGSVEFERRPSGSRSSRS